MVKGLQFAAVVVAVGIAAVWLDQHEESTPPLPSSHAERSQKRFGVVAEAALREQPTVSHGALRLELPATADAPLLFDLDDGEKIVVREDGIIGSREGAGSVVSYARRDGRAYWTHGADGEGREEWLEVDAGLAYAGHTIARWTVERGRPHLVGDIVLVADTNGRDRLRVSAPLAVAEGGRSVHVALNVVGADITLEVDAQGEAVFVDPWWTLYGFRDAPIGHT